MIIWVKYRCFDYSGDINLVTGLIAVRDVFRREIDRREVGQFKRREVRKDFPRYVCYDRFEMM